MPLILGSNSVSGYTVKNSLRFNSGSSDYLNRTFASNGTDRKIRTISCWVKRAKLGTEQVIIGGDDLSTNQSRLVFLSGDTLNCRLGGASANDNTTTAVFRDVSAWYHIVAVIDTTQATAANRVKIYVNGTQQTVSSPSSTQNQTTSFACSTTNGIGIYGSLTGGGYYDGYISELYFIDGQALDPTSFGQTDTDTGIWIPKAYTGTYGTNGFYLKFANSASLGTDSSPYNMLTAQTDGTTNGIQRGADLTGIANGKTGTISMWCNFTASSSGTQVLWVSRNNTTIGNFFSMQRNSAGNITVSALNSAGTTIMNVSTTTTPLASAGLYHIYFSWDLTGTNKAYLYINGSSVSLTYTTFTNDTIQYSVPNHGLAGNLFSPFSPTTPAMFGQVYVNYSTYLDPVTNINKFYGGTSTPVSIGSSGEIPSGSSPIVYLDGNATGILVNKGTGGNFSAYGTLSTGTTYSGTGNNINSWTVNNLTSVDQSTDTPTNNFCTLNPLDSVATNAPTFSNGNLTVSTSSTGASPCRSTFCVDKGKWYWEIKKTSASSADTVIGIMEQSEAFNTYIGSTAKGYGYISTANKVNNSSQSSYGATYTNGDIIGVALDMDNGTLVFYKNGTSQGTAYSSLSGLFSPAHSDAGTGTETADCNFGNPPYSANSYQDANGIGNFSYSVPSGYYALCTKNLYQYGF